MYPQPNYPQSTLIKSVILGKHRFHKGDGDMWPITWAKDGNLYGGAGDNCNSAMNFWRIEGDRQYMDWAAYALFLVNNNPVDHKKYCRIPPADPKRGIKPAGLLSIDGTLYFAVEAMNYGEDPSFNRQRNIHGWIITSTNYGVTWNIEATPTNFFEDRLSSCHFLQFGQDYAGARDNYVYAYFPAADDNHSYWENGDHILLGRVDKNDILKRDKWEFCVGISKENIPEWSNDDSKAIPIFSYYHMTGENHVVYNPGIKRYIMGNYGFMTTDGIPRPYHQGKYPESVAPSQLTLFEAPEPWGPWSIFHIDNDWGTVGDYQPNFPTKWISDDGTRMWMVSSGTFGDYNFTVQKVTLIL